MLRRIGLLAALALPLAVPAGAPAGTATRAAGVITWTDGAGVRDNVEVFAGGSEVVFFVFEEGETIPRGHTTPGPGCAYMSNDPEEPEFSMVSCPLAATDRVVVQLGGGDDDLNSSADVGFGTDPSEHPLELHGGPGDDTMKAGAVADLVTGGDGDDALIGLDGDDRVDGGAGNDRLLGWRVTDGDDDVRGGPGFDTADYEERNQGERVSLDDVANDGPATGLQEADNVHSDIEDVTGSFQDDIIVGSAGANVLDGGFGADTITGGGGFDRLAGEAGADTLRDRDGNADRLDCGGGTDTATSDTTDETSGCETDDASDALVADVDKDGVARPADCADRNPAIRPGAADAPDDGIDQDCNGADATIDDRDGDGSPRRFDCDDANTAIRPGAPEVYGNPVDEDCDGRADPLQILDVPLQTSFATRGGRTRIRRLAVGPLRKGTTVRARCQGGGCPFERKTIRVRKATKRLDLRKRLGLRVLRAGARLEITLRRADSVPQVTRLRFRAGALPEQRTRRR